MNKFLDLVLGTTDVPTYMAGFLFAIIGLMFSYYFKISKRDKYSSATPDKFKIGFFIQDNFVDVGFTLLAIIMLMRFSVEYAGTEVTMIYSFGLGVGATEAVKAIARFQAKSRE